MCEKGEQYTDCKGQEMKVSACTQGMGSMPLNQLCRDFAMTGGQPARGLAIPMGSASSACSVSRARTSHLEDATMAGDGRAA